MCQEHGAEECRWFHPPSCCRWNCCLPPRPLLIWGCCFHPSLSPSLLWAVSGGEGRHRHGESAGSDCPCPIPTPGQQHRWTSPRICAPWARPVLAQAHAPSRHHFCGTDSTEVTLISEAKQTNPHGRAATARHYGSISWDSSFLPEIMLWGCSVL